MTNSLDKEVGVKLLEDATAAIEKTVREKGGDIKVVTAARAVTERDDKLLSALMETLDKQNQEVDGDADEE